MNYSAGQAYAHRIIGVAHWAQGNYEEGLSHLLQSLTTYQTIADTLGMANAMMNIGLIYQAQASYEEALAYYQEAATTFEELNRPRRWINTANHLSELYQLMGHYEQARVVLEEVQQRSDDLQYAYGQATALQNLGMLYKVNNQLDSALAFCQQALLIHNRHNFVESKANTLYTIGTIYLAQGKLDLAEEKLLHSLKKARKVSSKKIRSDIYRQLKDISVAQGDYQAALGYANDYAVMRDSLLNAEKLRELVRLENRFALEKKDREVTIRDQQIELLEQDRKIKAMWRNILAFSTLLLFWFLLAAFQISRMRRRKAEQLVEIQQALADTELENEQLRTHELQQELHYRNKELTSYTLNFVQKNQLMEELNQSLQELSVRDNPGLTKKLRAMQRRLQQSTNIDRDWEDFKRHFENVHQDFFTSLKQQCPDLTHNELKLCALLKLNLNLKEVAGILGIAPESVKTARYRLRKKFGLSREDSLLDYIFAVEAASSQEPHEEASTKNITHSS
ncbi:MAG: tetratricopeptide repeat protein [Tunicatimonas sp.]